jgi:hypothetical protein
MFPMMGGVFDTYNAELLSTADTHLVGRISFDLALGLPQRIAKHASSNTIEI